MYTTEKGGIIPIECAKHHKKVFLQLFGEIGLAKMNYSTVLFNPRNNKGIVKTNNVSLVEAKSGILFLKGVAGSEVIPRILYVSGTINKAKSKMK